MVTLAVTATSINAATLIFPENLNANTSRLSRLYIVEPGAGGMFGASRLMQDGMIFAKK
jgi:hypothetical protein